MSGVIRIEEHRRRKAFDELKAARAARDDLDTRAQLEHAERAFDALNADDLRSDRALAVLLEATGLAVDAHGATADHEAAKERASSTCKLLLGHGVPPMAHEVAARHLRRAREVAGEADAMMRDAMVTYFRLRRSSVDNTQRDIEAMSALTTVLSAAHRVGDKTAHSFGVKALEAGVNLHAAVARNDARAAARYDMWAGLFISGGDDEPERALPHLDAYVRWAGMSRTKRNDLLAEMIVAERVFLTHGGRVARDLFIEALDQTRIVLPRKHGAAEEILARRRMI